MKINANHGSGGKETSALINNIFLKSFGSAAGNGSRDAAVLQGAGRLAFTCDGFVVKPLFFKGGDIGRLAVCGTVNDLLTTGAVPRYLSASFILEEGLETEDIERVARSMAVAAQEAGIMIVTGDTKVVEGGGGMYISTSGIGEIRGEAVDFSSAGAGDSLLVTGNLGSHHACIMSARMEIDNDIESDVAPLCEIVSCLLSAGITIHGMRDITRGGLATVLSEISAQHGLGAVIEEEKLPVSRQVAGFCAILGLDPLYMGNEGNMLLAVPEEQAENALGLIRRAKYGQNAAVIGRLDEGNSASIITKIGGKRKLSQLAGESLPRIC